ncbi:MAG: insulinase family protein [Acidobacteria bacterium]|nr:MAG: insulinase family protein [Acidobacteriota bacterium]
MKRTFLALLIVIVALGTSRVTLLGQGPEESKSVPLSQVVRLNRAPVNKEILRVKLPRPREFKLDNGLDVLVLERHKLPTVSFMLWIKTGALDDPRDLPGLAGFTAEMLREGTTHRSSAQIAKDVDDIGASLGASAGFGNNTSSVTASGLVENTDRILELMSDVVLNPTFPDDELAKFKKRRLADLQQMRSEPSFLARERFYSVLYGDFPASEVAATPESVNKVTRDELEKFHSEYYAPNNAILGVAGDVDYDSIVPLIKKYFGGWQSHPVNDPRLPPLPKPSAAKVVLVDRPDSVQTNILAGNQALRRNDPDYIPLVVTNHILGGGPAARLFLDLREEKGYTYGAYSYMTPDIYPGPWIASTEVRTAVTDGSMQALMDEFRKIRNEDVPEKELDEAQRAIVSSFALSLESPTTLLRSWLTVDYYKLSPDYWDQYPEDVAKVTPQVVKETAQKYIDLDHLQVVCVGSGKDIKDVLKKYGPLEVYDTNGKRIE